MIQPTSKIWHNGKFIDWDDELTVMPNLAGDDGWR